MQSLQEDISLRLLASGAQIVDQAGDLTGGFRVGYKVPRAVGAIRVEPLKTIDADAQGVCKSGIAVRLKVSMPENWYKQESETAAELMPRPS
jgi:hypothetical protein